MTWRIYPALCLALAWGCGRDTTSITPPPPPAAVPHLVMLWGDNQSAEVSHRLEDSLVVRLVNPDGTPVPNKRINWTVATIPGGELSQPTSTTDANGEAFNIWTMGTTAGTEGARAEYGTSSSISFSATAVARPQPPPPPDQAAIVHYDGTSWATSLKGRTSYGFAFASIWGSPQSAPWAGGPCMYSYSSGTWNGPTGCFTYEWTVPGIWGVAANNVYAIVKRRLRSTFSDYIIHFDGSSWNIVYNTASDCGAPPCAVPDPLNAISGRPEEYAVAVGRGGFIVRLVGPQWTRETSGTTSDLNGVWADPHSTNIFAVGSGGTILHHDGTSWGPQTSGTTATLYAISGISATDVFAVGANGTILHYDGTSWTPQVSGTTQNLRGVWEVSPTSVFAVGDAGTILHYDGSTWEAQASGAQTDWTAVWGSSSSDVFVVGG